ncbi:reverse transcriptase domain-containing protein [Tanacetum coccineum]|uniref:Reverse transcriptase domain-containing protein n=1 Tax=Tanacetum coccineum TaxID=301880 RepID=A0ABQ5EIQ1_9ASTR
MSTHEQTPPSQPTSAVRNTLGKEQVPQDLQEKLKAVKAEEGALRKGLDQGMLAACPEVLNQGMLAACPEVLNQGTIVPNHQGRRIWKEEQWHRSYYSSRRDTKSCYRSSRSRETEIAAKKHRHKKESSQRTDALSESKGSARGKSKPKKQKSSVEDDLSQPWVCEETGPFTPRIRYFDFPRTRMPSHIKTYDGSEDPEDHLKIFQAAAKTERWTMPTWCHMFNSTLTGNARVWFDDLPKESIDSYDDLRKAFLENYLQQKKCIKDPVEIHNIKQREGESMEEFIRRYKLEYRDVNGAPECMKIFGFMHGITNPELIKRLHDKIPKSIDEMMRVTMAFLRGEVAASNHERKKSFSSWKQHEAGLKQNFKKGNFRNQQRTE